MASKRDNLFPATSIGRSPSPSRTASHESLAAHPLLSSAPSYTGVPAEAAATGNAASSSSPRYVPYTPRHRTTPVAASAPGAATLQPSVVSVSPQQSTPHMAGGDARSKLQLVSLKGAAQAAGLETGSFGWAILERLVAEGEQGPEWAPIWDALVVEKATLLLPSEPTHAHESITADVVKDHVIICEGASREDAPIITLSGLRGQLSGDTLVFRSSLHPESKTFRSLLPVSSRVSTLATLAPLPLLPPSPSVPYPAFTVPTYAPSLPLQPRHTKPLAASVRGSPLHVPSRLPNPFAFFGKAAATASAPSTPAAALAEHEPVISVPAFILDRRVSLKDVGKQLTKALRAEAKDALAGAGVPSAVMDRTLALLDTWQPLLKVPKKDSGSGGGSLMSPNYAVNPVTEDADVIEDALQDFYGALEEDLHATSSPTSATLHKRRSDADDEKERDRAARKQVDQEARIKDTLEAVERTICTLLYDRLFCPTSSDDVSHDKALSSRLAALNETDLGLEHLGVDVGKASFEVETVVAACGQMLATLPACQSPADKSAILVAAHKVVVDGLSRLPPIRLKSDAEIAGQSTPRSSRFSSVDAGKTDDSLTNVERSTTTTDGEALEGVVSPVVVTSPEGMPAIAGDTSPLLSPPAPSSGGASPALQVRPGSPLLTISPPPERTPTAVSSDTLLPLLIYAVVKRAPERLVSHLLFIQRCRNRAFGGEEAFCLVNLLAVADFVENVDLAALGLAGAKEQVPSTADLTPIPLSRSGDATSPQLPPMPAGLRGRVEQQVDALAGSANKVLSAAVDGSFGMLRAMLPAAPGDGGAATPAVDTDQAAAPWNTMRPAFGILRRESGFSIASLAASLPGAGVRARSFRAEPVPEEGRQMVEVASRPASRAGSLAAPAEESGDEDEDGSEGEEESAESGDDAHDARSIRSFESMLSSRRKAVSRKSLSDRLASMTGLSRVADANKASGSPPSSRPSSMLISDLVLTKPSPPVSRQASQMPSASSPPISRRSSLLPPAPETPAGSRDASPAPAPAREPPPLPPRARARLRLGLAPPSARFLECAADGSDLRLGEVRELLAEYRMLVAGVRSVGGFDE